MNDTDELATARSNICYQTALLSADWISAHIYFDAPTPFDGHGDEIILRRLAPVVEECSDRHTIQGFFFVRFRDDRSHLRVRLRVRNGHHRAEIERLLVDRGIVFTDESKVGSPLTAPAPRAIADTGRAPVAVWTTYEPETARYGGPLAIRVAERIFETSSCAAFGLLRMMGSRRERRLGQALLAMLVGAYVFTEPWIETLQLTRQFAQDFLPLLALRHGVASDAWDTTFALGYERQAGALARYVGEARDRLTSGESLGTALDEYCARLARHATELRLLQQQGAIQVGHRCDHAWPDVVRHIVPSYLHMMNNRLGLTNEEESYVATILWRCLHDSSHCLS